MFFSNMGGMNMSNDDSLYKELGLEKSVSLADIKKAYKKMALKYHPDRNKDPDAEEKFKKISKAYDILSDEEKRKKYDMFGLDAVSGNAPSGPGGDPFDLFGNIFGGGGMRKSQFSKKRHGRTIVKEIEIDMSDIYNETKINMTLNNMRKCSGCDGKGGIDKDAYKNCQKCDGSGVFVKVKQIGPNMISQHTEKCDKCNGKGKILDQSKACKKCNGNRMEKRKSSLELKLTRETKDGDKIVFNEMADYDPDATAQGDLVLIIKERPNKYFKRLGNDILYVKTISLLEALCGLDLYITHLDDRILYVKMTEVIQPESIYKIKNEGISESSHLYVKFNVVLPSNLSDERKMYIKKLIQTKNDDENTNTNTNNTLENKQVKFLDTLDSNELLLINEKIHLLSVKGANFKREHNQTEYDFVDENSDEEGIPACVQQ